MDPASILLAIGAIGGTAVAAIAGAAHLQGKVNEVADAAWRATARELDGRYLPPDGPWYRRTSRVITATIEGVSVKVDHYDESTGDSAVTYTRAVARAPAASGFKLSVQEAGLLTALGSAVGLQRVRYDDPAFDAARVVRASDEDLARHWVNRRLRAALRLCKGCVWKLESDALTLRHTGLVKDAKVLVHLATTTAGMARRGKALGRAWAGVGEALGARPGRTRRWPDEARIELDDGTVVEIERGALLGASSTRTSAPRSASANDTWSLRLRTAHDGGDDAGEPVDLGDAFPEHALWSSDPLRATRRFDGATIARIREIDPRAIEATAEAVTIDLPGLVLDAKRIEAAVSLVRDLRTGMGSAYR